MVLAPEPQQLLLSLLIIFVVGEVDQLISFVVSGL